MVVRATQGGLDIYDIIHSDEIDREDCRGITEPLLTTNLGDTRKGMKRRGVGNTLL